MRLIVTRPEAEAKSFAQMLEARGHEAILAPLLEIRTHEGPEIALSDVQGILATSANGVRALAARSRKRDVALYAVGPQTAEAARKEGFSPVHDAAGNSRNLVAYVARAARRGGGKLLHAAGEETAGEVRESLAALGFEIQSLTLYGAYPAEHLPAEVAKALREGLADGVLLFSPRSAKIFVKLIAESGLASRCARIAAYCISEASAQELAPVTFRRVAIARDPNQDSMLSLVG